MKIASLFLLAASLGAQTQSLISTTLSAPVNPSGQRILLASTTGITAASTVPLTPDTLLYIQGEAMRVLSVSGNAVTVARGQLNTSAVNHNTGAAVLAGRPNWFYTIDPTGSCSVAQYTPYLNVYTGTQWSCVGGNWAISGGPGSSGAATYTSTAAGAVTRLITSKLGDTVSVKDFGAVGDGTTDDTAKIQAAIDAYKPATQAVLSTITRITFPKGIYCVSSTLTTYSGIWLDGVGYGAVIKDCTNAVTGKFITSGATGGNNAVNYTLIRNLSFTGGTNLWVFQGTAGINVINSVFEYIYFDTPYGIDASVYTQGCVFKDIYSNGALDQLLKLGGNHNIVENIDKEGSSGSTTDPYILIMRGSGVAPPSKSNQWIFRNILLEQAGSANKTTMQIQDTSNVEIDGLWFEVSNTDGYFLRLDNAQGVHIRGYVPGVNFSSQKFSLVNSTIAEIDKIDVNGAAVPPLSFIEVDATSQLRIKEAYTRNAANSHPLVGSANIVIDRVTVAGTPAAYSIFKNLIGAAPNTSNDWLTNPSFETGIYGWTASANSTQEFIQSEVSTGLMGHWVFTVGSGSVSQSITIPTQLVGVPMTISLWAKLDGSTGQAVPLVSGAGVTSSTGSFQQNAGAGWGLISYTFIPQSAGAVTVGVRFVNAVANVTNCWADDFTITVGSVANPNQPRYQQLELTGKTFIYGTAAPATGTWKLGDFVMNSAPSTYTPIGWRCMAAGTPGTWQAVGQTAIPVPGTRVWMYHLHNGGATITGAVGVDLGLTAASGSWAAGGVTSGSMAYLRGTTGIVSGQNAYVRSSNTALIGGNSKEPVIKWYTRLSSADTTNQRVWIGGFADNAATIAASDTPINHQLAFRYSTSVPDTHWQCTSSDGTTQTITDSGVTPDLNWHEFLAQRIGNTLYYYIDQALVCTITTHLPNSFLVPTALITTLTGSAKIMDYQYFYGEQKPN